MIIIDLWTAAGRFTYCFNGKPEAESFLISVFNTNQRAKGFGATFVKKLRVKEVLG